MIGVTFDSPKENFREYGFLSVVQQSEVRPAHRRQVLRLFKPTCPFFFGQSLATLRVIQTALG